jgi:3-hydroxymyristoyl/3-hydroxydecanoyl-(acyl carrier protein) dehydratase
MTLATTTTTGMFTIAHDHPALPGHFPGAPIVPGVVLLEHVLAAIDPDGTLAPLRLRQVKFLRPLLPGETAGIEVAAMEQSGATTGRWRFRVRRGDTLLASGEVASA